MSNQLFQKTVVVTGATSGIGFHAALKFAKAGAFVIGTARNKERGLMARARIEQQVPGARLFFAVADLASQAEVNTLADQVKNILNENGEPSLDILINNAGTYVERKTLTIDGIEKTFAVNHLAPFYLTHLLLPSLEASETGKVLTVSSNSHYHTRFNPASVSNPRFYFGLWAYKVSKLANVLFTTEFNRRNTAHSLFACAVDPGLVNTDIGLKETGRLIRWVWSQRQRSGASADGATLTLLRLAGDAAPANPDEIYWRECVPKPPNRQALDPHLAYRLWEESCRLCNIHEFFAK